MSLKDPYRTNSAIPILGQKTSFKNKPNLLKNNIEYVIRFKRKNNVIKQKRNATPF